MEKIFLMPGQWHLSKGNELITTLLGSCVSIIFYSEKENFSLVTHYLLPDSSIGSSPSSLPERYGNGAIARALNEIKLHNVNFNTIKAKVFGGANVNEGNSIGEAIGASNLIFAFQELALMGIPVTEENVGGFKGRKIIFNSSTFEVEHKFNN